MLTEYRIKRGFGANHTKEFFVVQADGDTLGGIVAGPFENLDQCVLAMDALRSLYKGRLKCASGHMVRWADFELPSSS